MLATLLLVQLGLPVPADSASRNVAELPDFAGLVARNGAAVVNISTAQTVRRTPFPGTETPDAPGLPFGDLLRDYLGNRDAPPEYLDSSSLGSGFVITPDGYILTCAHVVENAREIRVNLTDRREFAASLVGSDRRSDIALLKIEATGLSTVRAGDPRKLRVGDWVLAIGSPFGFESSATAGIVSAKGRSLPRENYVPFIQTDVAINPGNSGGPLFNLAGEVVGINSQIYSRTGGFMGLSFAVPIDMAMAVADQLRTSGHFRRGWLGVNVQDVSRDLAESFGLPRPQGALVADILPDSPAARSELRVGDVVVDYEGRPIQISADLPPMVGQTLPGMRVKVGVIRAGRSQQLQLVIGELPDDATAPTPLPGEQPEAAGVLGMALSELNPQQRKQRGVVGGVSVDRVGPGAGLKAGLRAGDVILQLDGRNVATVTGFHQMLAHLPKGRPIPVLVRRGAGAMFLALRIPE